MLSKLIHKSISAERLLVVGFTIIYITTILQNYIFSHLKNTGFYFSESAVYNTIWLLYIPFLFLLKSLLKNKEVHWFTRVGGAIVASLAHVLIFSLLFFIFSYLVFQPHHLFNVLLKSATANYFLISVSIYFIIPLVFKKKTLTYKNYKKNITVKKNDANHILEVNSISKITSEKPYVAIHHEHEKYLFLSSLSAMEKQLDSNVFIRVHRSAIVNKNFVREMKSRKNGDYNVFLQNDMKVRFSRHYSKNWKSLLST